MARVIKVIGGLLLGGFGGLVLAVIAGPTLISAFSASESGAMGTYFLMFFGAPVIGAVLGAVVMARSHD